MSYYIILRGPLGCGKTTIANELAKKLNGTHIAIDDYIEKNKLYREKEEGYISQKSFIKVNKMAAPHAEKLLKKGKVVVFDGNFYWKSQIEDLIKRLKHPHYVFTLKAPLKVCIERDSKRKRTYGTGAATVVYNKVMSFEYGRSIDVTQSQDKVLKEIISYLPHSKLEDIIRKRPFNLDIRTVAPISSHNAMSGESFKVTAKNGNQYKLRYCENIKNAEEIEKNVRLLPHAFPKLYGRDGHFLLSEWIKGKEPPRSMAPRLCYQLGKLIGESHALNKVDHSFDLDKYMSKHIPVLEKSGIFTKKQLRHIMEAYRELKKRVNYQVVLELTDIHTGNLLVTSKGKLLFVDEDGFHDSLKGKAFVKPVLRYGWMKQKKQRDAFWKGYRENYDDSFFTKDYEKFVSLVYAFKIISFRYSRGTDYSKELIRLRDAMKK